ncbi:MAG: serine/threonine protein kinase [Deltaproteobacteria bacterium]|nr:serine/threonine protein kinase [Deltaproteobacteria bacterium]
MSDEVQTPRAPSTRPRDAETLREGDALASTPSSGSGGGRDRVLGAMLRVASHEEQQINRRRMSIAYAIAAVLVPSFASIDFLFHAIDPSFPLEAILAIRLAVAPALFVAALRTRRPEITTKELERWVMLAPVMLTTAMALSVMATGMLDSPYVSGLLLVACGYPFVPQHYRRAIGTGVYATLVFPALYLAWAFAGGDRDAMLAPGALALLVTIAAIHGSGIVVLVLAAHWLWALRKEVFESRTIGRYRVQTRIGRGGMGEVWSAWDATLKRDVALKVLRTDQQDPVAVARFEREVRATTELTHPNTVRVYDFGATDDGISYYAMELLRGEPLSALSKREAPLPPARVVWIATQVARALAEAHARGIVHRDIKPENVFMTLAGDERDHAKVLDFGIARITSAAETGLTQTGVIGTPQYLAPELLLGDKATPRADVYALGVVTFQLLTGAFPFAAEDARALLLARMTLDPRDVRELVPELPEVLADVVRRALAREPSERYADGGALADALAGTGLLDGHRPERIEHA